MTFIVWSVGETYGRETWRDHFRSLDLLSFGNLFHSAVGKSMLGGIAAGLLLNAVHHLLILFASGYFDVWFALPQVFFNVFNAILPSVANYALVTYNSLTIVSIMFVLIPMLLLRRSHSVVLPLLTAAVIYGFVSGMYIQPMPVGIVTTALIGLAFLFLFYRTDVLTLLLAFFTYHIADWGIVYLFIEQPQLKQDGLLFIIPFIGLLVFSVGGLLSRDKEVDAESLEPHYVRFISERERLQREIEIARDVQMSFLPKMTPHVPDLDIAARCIPANEIGGDYYDFVQLHHNRTGILIGDVSGKGTKAAFYMTLAKGMMHTTINGKDSPAEVLTKVNEQFYRHTDRRAFISMVYGIFDTDKQMLTVSRAGHNPIIHFQKQQQKSAFIYPNGIALGLDKGEKFSYSIKDKTTRIEPGDIVVFYTDGITEAMNKNREEFGNQRLFETITDNQDNDAQTILDNIFLKVNNYTRNTKQSDDMTMIVVKMK